MKFPKVALVRQTKETPVLKDIVSEVHDQVAKLALGNRLKPGASIAITAGSRGISNMALIQRCLVNELKALGARPFLVPTMGSHGGATAEGQIAMLNSLGITEETVGAPIVSSMEVTQVGITEIGCPVYVDKNALSADGIVVINRVKEHTEFSAEIESGMMKMMVIGLGKHLGALTAHRYALSYGLYNTIIQVARVIMEKAPILFGVGIVENLRDETAIIRCTLPEGIEETEKELLMISKKLLPRLPFQKIDVLIVSEMGKQISGAGMDPNIIGRCMNAGEPELAFPRITRIAVLDLIEASHGNATGMGLADFASKRFFDKVNFNDTYVNCITGLVVEKGRTPIISETDQKAIENAMLTCGPKEPEMVDLVWIKNTLQLDTFFVSETLLPKICDLPNFDLVTPLEALSFDSNGNIQGEFRMSSQLPVK